MKILFFLLALANVGLFMWEYHKGGLPFALETPAENATDYPEQILLLSESDSAAVIAEQFDKTPIMLTDDSTNVAIENSAVKTDQTDFLSGQSTGIAPFISKPSTPETAPNNPEITSTDSSKTDAIGCFEAGPFTNEQDYKAWANRLGDFIQPIKRDEQVISGYLVYYPAAKTPEQSKADLQMLKDKGVKDLWLLTQGAEQGQISLGAFDKEEKAVLMKNALLAKGINAEVRARHKANTQRFAVVRGESNVIENLEILKKAYPSITVKKIDGAITGDCL